MLKLKFQYFGHLMWRAAHWKRPWCRERLKAGGEGDDRGWDGWIASLSRWTWVWVSFRSWWWTGRPGMLWSMGSQRVGHDWVTELNWSQKMSLKMVYQALKSKQILYFKNYFENKALYCILSSGRVHSTARRVAPPPTRAKLLCSNRDTAPPVSS